MIARSFTGSRNSSKGRYAVKIFPWRVAKIGKKKKRNKKDKKKDDEEEELIYGWAKVSLSDKQVLYAALDARLGFEITRRHWKLEGYNSHV
jgi:hypothetical protein